MVTLSVQFLERVETPWHVLNDDGTVAATDQFPDLGADELRSLMERMLFTRVWDERAIKWTRQGKLGFYAPVSGQEACMIGSQAALAREDFILPSYRDLPQMVWHGLPLYQAFLYSLGHQHGNEIPADVNVLPPQIIIGAQVVQAAGVAMAFRLRKESRVVLTFIGDGGTSQGDFYEGLNVAGVSKLPVVFFIQNNQFAISTAVAEQTAVKELKDKAKAVGIMGERIDGMDVLAVYATVRAAVAKARAGGGPTLIEALTFRYGPHTMSGDDPHRYRTEELEESWREKDPLARLRRYLVAKNLWTDADDKRVKEKAIAETEAALKQAREYPAMTMAGLANSMFADVPAELEWQIAKYGIKGGAVHAGNDDDSSD